MFFDDVTVQLASDYYYYSDDYFEIVDLTDTDPVVGVLKSGDIPIIQTLDWREHKASIGGFSINLIDEGISDLWNTNNISNRAIWIYLGTDDLDSLTDYLLLYKGVCKDGSVFKDVFHFTVEKKTL